VIRTLLAASLALLTFAAACGGGSSSTNNTRTAVLATAPPTGTPDDCTPARAHPPGDLDQTIVSGTTSRTYILHIPTGYEGAMATPVVLAFHGFGLNARQMADYTRLPALADQQGFILVTPDGTGAPQHWNWRKASTDADDERFVSDVLAKLGADLCLDQDRIFSVGFSDGAAMSRVLACDLADRFAAIGVVASPSVPCVAAVPMIAFHGTADPLVPFEGGVVPAAVGGGGTFPPVRRSVSEWARALGCDGLPTISRPTATVELSTFIRCKLGNGDVLLYTLVGGGHTWPGSAPLPVAQYGETNGDADATSTIWQFFVAHPLAH
jgi:polyhydroxybutyrate depolymerase